MSEPKGPQFFPFLEAVFVFFILFTCIKLSQINLQLELQTAMMEYFMQNIEVLELPEEAQTEPMSLVRK